MLPCVGQAALGIEIREDDQQLEQICAVLNDFETQQCVLAERAFLKGMGGGCQMAVAACAEVLDGEIWMRAVSFLGQRPQRGEVRGPMKDALELGRQLAVRLGGTIH
jgi:hydroxymethylbilane synthase